MALSRQKKKRLWKQANRQAARENSVSSPKAAIGQANRDYNRTARDAKGAQKVQLSQLSQMLQGVQNSGLSGKYAQQVKSDLRSRKAEAVSGLPYSLAIAAQERTDAIQDARASAADEMSARRDAAGRNFTSLLEEARDRKADRIEDRKESQGISDGVKNAMIVADFLLKNAKPKERRGLLSDRGAFAVAVAKEAEGADPKDAQEAINRLIRRMKKKSMAGTKATGTVKVGE